MEDIRTHKERTLDLVTHTLRVSGMGNKEVKERMEGLGYPISEPLITNMRKGRHKHAVSFERLLAWYEVLGINYQFPSIKTTPSQAKKA